MNQRNLQDFGFVRVAAATPILRVANFEFNTKQIAGLIKKAETKGAQVVVFPELSLTGYTANDLFHQDFVLEKSKEFLGKLLAETSGCGILAVIGMPIACDSQLFNCAVIFQGNRILGVVPKTYIPGYKEFYEKRWFASAKSLKSNKIEILGQSVPIGTNLLFRASNFPRLILGVEICEDLWVPIPPSSYQALAGATLLLNLSASNELVGKADYRRLLVMQQSARCIAGYVYSSASVGESTTDTVFGGHAIIAENGVVLAESERFLRDNQFIIRDIDLDAICLERQRTTSFGDAVQESQKAFATTEFSLAVSRGTALERTIDSHPFVPRHSEEISKRCADIFSIQVSGLATRLEQTGVKKVLVGVSGGLDSTLALLVAVETFDLLGRDRQDIIALTMPGFGTSRRTRGNAIQLCKRLGVSFREIDIKKACLAQFQDLGHDPLKQDVVFENVQARYRTSILFNLGNEVKGLVLGTGDLSEIALGWCTYGGDHMSHYHINAGVPKTLVKVLVDWIGKTSLNSEVGKIVADILDTPISPELVSGNAGEIAQKTEDTIGPYELHDFFLYYFVRWGINPRKIIFLARKAFGEKYTNGEIKKWFKVFISRFFANQWKRSCMPDGPKVGSVSLSPRGDWRMSSDTDGASWINDLEDLEEKI